MPDGKRKRPAEAPQERPCHPDQASMFMVGGGSDTPSCLNITEFSWEDIERRLNELASHELLKTADDGLPQRLPWPPGARDVHQLESQYVVAVSLNNHACEHDLPFQFMVSVQFPNGPTPDSELYVVNKEWSEEEKGEWLASSALARCNWSSLEHNPGFDWASEGLLALPIVLHFPPRTLRLPGKREDAARSPWEWYELRVPNTGKSSFTSRSLSLVVHMRDSWLRLLAVMPGEVRVRPDSTIGGWISDKQRCAHAKDIVTLCRRLIEDMDNGTTEDLRRRWVAERGEREGDSSTIRPPAEPDTVVDRPPPHTPGRRKLDPKTPRRRGANVGATPVAMRFANLGLNTPTHKRPARDVARTLFASLPTLPECADDPGDDTNDPDGDSGSDWVPSSPERRMTKRSATLSTPTYFFAARVLV
ncbi:hypothetical protein DM02DRAFT_627912 [Periconia macrospinosa]|uniref:Uncharacterized protein n=1 Tax=Periconia macrospinosa TaxID=97972 RepID=A0A2V1DV20_9PLEO|nr:hypothetical protein DM02DRAFT_627912 [Periconia macrospinosa]